MKQSFSEQFVDYCRMVAVTLKRLFPEREFMMRTHGRIRFKKISTRLQIGMVGFVLILAGWGAFASTSYYLHGKIVENKDSVILNGQLKYRSLLSDISSYQQRFAFLTKELEDNHALMLSMVEKNGALRQDLRTTESQLENSKLEKNEVLMAREGLKSRLSETEQQMKALNSHNFELKGNLNSVATVLENALSQRDAARTQSRELESTVGSLKGQLASLHASEASILEQLSQRTTDLIGEISQVVDRTGLKSSALVAASKPVPSKGQGGPFFATNSGDEPAERLKISLTQLNQQLAHLDELRELVNTMPLAAPLDYFDITSHFGKRQDPINRRWARHYGLDLGAAKRTAVFATAPGVVTKAGWKGRYGRIIEITHGNGFKTRYAHLHKILVKSGDKVDYRAKIGLVGNSGRSTAPHLHYEVVHKGKALNPWTFIKAGRYVYKNQ